MHCSTQGYGEPGAAEQLPRMPPKSARLLPEDHVVELCDCVIDIVSALFSVSGRDMRMPGRGSTEVARARQIAMYVCHVALGLKMRDVGYGFGRDRTTVMHACHLIEDLRDDAEFDRVLAVTERIAAVALRGRRR